MKVPKERLDYSLDSINIIQLFLQKVATTRRIPGLYFSNPTSFTKYLCKDIGMYIGKMFVINHENLWWNYYCLNSDLVNDKKPQVFGLWHLTFEPSEAVEAYTYHMDSEPDYLHRVCLIHWNDVPKNGFNEMDEISIIYKTICELNPVNLDDNELEAYHRIAKDFYYDYYFRFYDAKPGKLTKNLKKRISSQFRRKTVREKMEQAELITQQIIKRIDEYNDSFSWDEWLTRDYPQNNKSDELRNLAEEFLKGRGSK